ncbi:hypothetical protein HOT31_gp107 [Microbacterium phage Hendrix]|uniref:Uncharacterized protein n=1 Tax=Microbacterium phage Hendrix TaxID=2182341 RepID=A0A2U8UUD5_9CAUD|nr:hypothetical protein HOT31_gp107 [Microbacterium phage Hendrix]AWN07778.1 hypothetical protein PBI_HENDRIX_107 [Microbacterium phage Hendrix]
MMLGLSAVVHRELAIRWKQSQNITDRNAPEKALQSLVEVYDGEAEIVESWRTDWRLPGEHTSNLEDALVLIDVIASIRSVQRELKSAFAKSELDGGAKAAFVHPLYVQAQEQLDRLHDQLMMLI